jgi:hypothetical protein
MMLRLSGSGSAIGTRTPVRKHTHIHTHTHMFKPVAQTNNFHGVFTMKKQLHAGHPHVCPVTHVLSNCLRSEFYHKELEAVSEKAGTKRLKSKRPMLKQSAILTKAFTFTRM